MKTKLTKPYHLIYRNKYGEMQCDIRAFSSFKEVEDWLIMVGASDWEIGIPDNDLR